MKIAVENFIRYGIKAVSIENIASKLHVSKRTIYENFGSKTNLLIESIAYAIRQREEEICAIQNETSSPIEAIVGIYMRFLNQIEDICPALYMDMDYTPKLKEIMDGYTAFINDRWNMLIGDAFKEEYLITIDPDALKGLFQSQAMWIRSYKRQEMSEKIDISYNIFTTFLTGCSTEKGREEIERIKLKRREN